MIIVHTHTQTHTHTHTMSIFIGVVQVQIHHLPQVLILQLRLLWSHLHQLLNYLQYSPLPPRLVMR